MISREAAAEGTRKGCHRLAAKELAPEAAANEDTHSDLVAAEAAEVMGMNDLKMEAHEEAAEVMGKNDLKMEAHEEVMGMNDLKMEAHEEAAEVMGMNDLEMEAHEEAAASKSERNGETPALTVMVAEGAEM